MFLFLEGRAGRLRVSDGGNGGDPVVFVHGLGCDLEAWRAQLDHLRPKRRTIAYDQRGHGESDRVRDGVYTIAALDPAAPRKALPAVSHWLMMDDPDGFNRALDPFIGF